MDKPNDAAGLVPVLLLEIAVKEPPLAVIIESPEIVL